EYASLKPVGQEAILSQPEARSLRARTDAAIEGDVERGPMLAATIVGHHAGERAATLAGYRFEKNFFARGTLMIGFERHFANAERAPLCLGDGEFGMLFGKRLFGFAGGVNSLELEREVDVVAIRGRLVAAHDHEFR